MENVQSILSNPFLERFILRISTKREKLQRFFPAIRETDASWNYGDPIDDTLKPLGTSPVLWYRVVYGGPQLCRETAVPLRQPRQFFPVCRLVDDIACTEKIFVPNTPCNL